MIEISEELREALRIQKRSLKEAEQIEERVSQNQTIEEAYELPFYYEDDEDEETM